VAAHRSQYGSEISHAASRLRSLAVHPRRTENRCTESEIRAAILASAREKKGTLRRHVVTWTGRVRDSVYFSILDSEWPEVKARLEAKLAALTQGERTGGSYSQKHFNFTFVAWSF